MTGWRCKDCKQQFPTYEATAEHVRLVHGRKPQEKTFSEIMGMLDDFAALLTKKRHS